jgi:hypothetical protein
MTQTYTPKRYSEYRLPATPSQKKALKVKAGMKHNEIKNLNRKEAMDILESKDPRRKARMNRASNSLIRRSLLRH